MEELDVKTLRNDYLNHPDYLLDLLDKKCPELLDVLYPVYNAEDTLLIKRRRSTVYICLLDYVCRTSHISVIKEPWGQYGSNMREKILSDIHEELVDEGKEIDDGIGEEQQQAVRRIIYDICKRNAEIREMIFKSDKELFESCNTKKEFEDFVLNHPFSYPEYILHAKYIIAKKSHTPFTDLHMAKEQYGECEWVKIIECKKTSSGIVYMITDDFFVDDNEKQCIISFLEDFSSIGSTADIIDGNKQRCLFANHVVTEELWNIVIKQHQLFTSNALNLKMVEYNELETFINKLQQITCVKFRIPTSNERKTFAVGIKEISENSQCLWEWCLSVDGDSPNIQVACNKRGQDTQDNRTYIYNVPNSCFAACRLVVDI